MKNKIISIFLFFLALQGNGCKKNCGEPVEPFTGSFEFNFTDNKGKDYFISNLLEPTDFSITNLETKKVLKPEIKFGQDTYYFLVNREFPDFYNPSQLSISSYGKEFCRKYVFKYSLSKMDTFKICLNGETENECGSFLYTSLKILNSRDSVLLTSNDTNYVKNLQISK